ncbi:protein SHQ1 homolog isoform X2 [Limulus polyphemus]|nr:protein SHQ1 homolog isoform X2 [Limulus polyphemus]XP_022254833.1 protein SHQ1 homolog isoform X2 [Limulus polyphemus]XP_022254834.1 protein SHQ1 homolog isoform X2 [Limulus polyphemus]
MLTPRFELTQNPQFVILVIHAPYTKVTDAELFFHGNDFKFFSKPYFLRLTLPGEVKENGNEKATYDAEKGTFTIKMPKMSPGEVFEGLDMITKLLTPSGKISAASPVIEVLDSTELKEDKDDDEFDWQIEQIPWSDDSTICGEKYGFANERYGVCTRLQEELPDLVDIKNPDHKSIEERRKERINAETAQFSDDHYLADMYQTELIQEVLEFQAPWEKLYYNLGNSGNADELVSFTEAEREQMKKLPKKEYLLNKATKQTLFLGLVDILYAYAYDVRTTEGEQTVESSWTISKLSATLSWLEVFTSLKSVTITTVRRSLCYPLLRNWNLAMKLIKDTQQILSLGRNFVLKCLLKIHDTLNDSDSRYVLNDLYITDYCVWVQNVKSKNFMSLAKALEKVEINKGDVNLDLEELEAAARLTLLEKEENVDIPTTDTSESCKSNSVALVGEQLDNLKLSETLSVTEEPSKKSSDQSDEDSATDSDDSSGSIGTSTSCSSCISSSSNSDVYSSAVSDDEGLSDSNDDSSDSEDSNENSSLLQKNCERKR